MDTAVALFYALTLACVAAFGLHRLALLRRFRWSAELPQEPGAELPREPGAELPRKPGAELASVTVQLPLYDERTVAGRLVRAVGALDWPAERLEIQVLDDSTDETREIVDREVAALRARGLDACVIRRPDRRGYKAGALDHGLRRASGELVAVFDADFVPPADFLRRMVDAFEDPAIGMVQARWGHENRDESALTRAQSTLLDGHFVIEHTVRHASGWFFNFNGTAGIWRRAAIEDAGGWQHDTLTEDLDLSYRAQLRGWRFAYRPLVVAPAEVPPSLAAFKSQQHRWAKGSVQVIRKLGTRILRSPAPARVKLEALAHLTGNVGYPCVLVLALLLPLTLRLNEALAGWVHLVAFGLCTASVVAFYERSQRVLGRPLRRRARDVVAAVSLGIGMCVSQTRAVLEGLLADAGAFERTPKRGEDAAGAAYRAVSRGLPGVELLLAAWLAWGIVRAVRLELWGSLPFLVLFCASFLWVGALSVRGGRVRGLG